MIERQTGETFYEYDEIMEMFNNNEFIVMPDDDKLQEHNFMFSKSIVVKIKFENKKKDFDFFCLRKYTFTHKDPRLSWRGMDGLPKLLTSKKRRFLVEETDPSFNIFYFFDENNVPKYKDMDYLEDNEASKLLDYVLKLDGVDDKEQQEKILEGFINSEAKRKEHIKFLLTALRKIHKKTSDDGIKINAINKLEKLYFRIFKQQPKIDRLVKSKVKAKILTGDLSRNYYENTDEIAELYQKIYLAELLNKCKTSINKIFNSVEEKVEIYDNFWSSSIDDCR